MARRPVIGISTAIERARWGSWNSYVLLSPRNYSRVVRKEGGLAVLLAPDDDAGALLDLVDGLLLPGGSDIDPAVYGAEPHPETNGYRAERDRFEIALAREAIERGIPVLGVCRGMELLNVALGGTLDQNIVNLDLHRHTKGAFGDHDVVLEPGSLAARAAGAERLEVKSHHHQGVGELGEGLVVTGRAPEDDLIEAVELPGDNFVLAVLWHPEEEGRSALVRSLVNASVA
jgi:putative glutamine amidotransferase